MSTWCWLWMFINVRHNLPLHPKSWHRSSTPGTRSHVFQAVKDKACVPAQRLHFLVTASGSHAAVVALKELPGEHFPVTVAGGLVCAAIPIHTP